MGTSAGDRLYVGRAMKQFDLNEHSLRDLNKYLHKSPDDEVEVLNPSGRHCIAPGIDDNTHVQINGHVGYYCGGMNKLAQITVNGNAGPGVAENMMCGKIRIKGNASQYAGASGRGGTLIIEGDASSRCGISMKGIDIIVAGDVGHMSGFMAQEGHLVVCGNAGDHLGDSLYEAIIFVRGSVGELGSDCIEKEMTGDHRATLLRLLGEAELDHSPDEFRRYGSARNLYHFNVDHADAY
jgi:glutamate synthase domain-containing protein 3